MPPKKQGQPPVGIASTNELTEANVAIIRAALCCLEEFKPNWALVLSQYGLGKGGHGLRDFKLAMAKLGLVVNKNKITMAPTAEVAAAAKPTAPAAKKEDAATGEKDEVTAAGTKRKTGAEEQAVVEDAGAKPAQKKQKKPTKAVVKAEEKE